MERAGSVTGTSGRAPGVLASGSGSDDARAGARCTRAPADHLTGTGAEVGRGAAESQRSRPTVGDMPVGCGCAIAGSFRPPSSGRGGVGRTTAGAPFPACRGERPTCRWTWGCEAEPGLAARWTASDDDIEDGAGAGIEDGAGIGAEIRAEGGAGVEVGIWVGIWVEVRAGAGAEVGVEGRVEGGIEVWVGAGIEVEVWAWVGSGGGGGVAAEVDAGVAFGAVPTAPAPPGRTRPEPVGPCAPADPFTAGVGAFGRLNHRVRGDVSPEPVGRRASRPGAAPRLPSVGTPRSADRRRAVGAESEPVASDPVPAHRGRTTGRSATRCTDWNPLPVLVVRGR